MSGGKQFRRSLRTTDRKLADRRLADLKAQIGALSITKDANLTFEQVAQRWLESVKHSLSPGTAALHQTRTRNLAHAFPQAIRNVTSRDCELWAGQRAPQIAPGTFDHELDVLKAVFTYAQRHGLILANPAANLKRRRITQTQIVVPTRQQFQQLVQTLRGSGGHADEQATAAADLVQFLAYSGARVGEPGKPAGPTSILTATRLPSTAPSPTLANA